MKHLYRLLALALTTQLWSQVLQNKATEPKPNYTELQILEALGWSAARQTRLTDLGLDAAQILAIQKGFALSLEGKDSAVPMVAIGPQLQAYTKSKLQRVTQKLEQAAKNTESAYFTELKKKASIKSTVSGLHYEILDQGSTEKPVVTDQVTVDYEGRLLNGTVFDSSKQRGPATFGLKSVIPGWTEGMQLIGLGGKIRLYIPYALGYGAKNMSTIPAFSTLVFEITLISKKPYDPKAHSQHSH